MALKKIEMLASEPITLDVVKAYLRIEHNKEDGLIESFMSAARASIEAYTSRALIKQKWQVTLNAGYALSKSDSVYLTGQKSRSDDGIELPRSPFIKLVGNPVLISDYGTQDIKDFRVDSAGRAAYIHFGPNVGDIFQETANIQIEFIAGYEAKDLPDSLKQAILMIVAQLYENRVAVNDNPGLVGEFNQGVLTLIKPYQVKRLA